jgi:hypothetical protein
MAIYNIEQILIWCIGINYAILIVWFCVFIYAHNWLFELHSRWFKLSVETFDVINYAAMASYKIAVMLFNVVPLIALLITQQ